MTEYGILVGRPSYNIIENNYIKGMSRIGIIVLTVMSKII